MLIEIHMLKNYPPVNLNRDDSGAPKVCFFGGVQRGRISSQCLKRSWRESEIFKQVGSFGVRTRHMPALVADKLREMGVGDDYIAVAQKMLTGVANKDGKVNSKGLYTTQIVIYAPEDIDKLALSVKDAIDKDESLEKFKKRGAKDFAKLVDGARTRPVTADIALFGRMVTSECFRDVEAAMQVAHAISTHKVNRESDYFTAIDDLLEGRDELGAGMMGDIDYNSCCYYEYASLDVDQLRENLRFSPDADELVAGLVPALLRAMAFTNPSGKQNTFAGNIFPDAIVVERKNDKIPLSYVNAFEEPVPTFGRNPRIVENSVKRLFDEIDRMDAAYGLEIANRAWLMPKFGEVASKKGEKVDSFGELTALVASWIKEG